ncbi:MAG: M1 family aminopeptidase [Pyrinomonadaceae bacterium]
MKFLDECLYINKAVGKDTLNCLEIPKTYQENKTTSKIYVRKSQAEKFKQHAAETFRLNREAVKYLESYFDYKFPFPKYDLVLIPEFPFGGMEHAGATFLARIFRHFPVRADGERLHLTRQPDFSRSRASMVRRHGNDEMV